MKFSTAFSVTLLALAKLIVADSEQFGLVSIRSGSNLQYASVYYQDDKLYVGSGSDSLGGTVTDAGKLKLTDDKFAVVNSDGSIGEGSEDDGTAKFSIKNGHLAYNNIDGFYAIPTDSKYVLSVTRSDDSTGIALKAMGSGGQSVADFTPSGDDDTTTTTLSSETSTSTEAPTSTEAATSTEAPTSTEASSSNADAISQIDDGQIQAATTTTAEAASQIDDGQVQATTATTAEAASQIDDGQVQATTATTAEAVSQIEDGQIQATSSDVQVVESNGAQKGAIGLGAGVFAAAAAFLL